MRSFASTCGSGLLHSGSMSRPSRFAAVLDQLEAIVNDLSDKDWSWWPFLWLRPAREARLSRRRLVTMAVLYGLPLSLAFCLALRSAVPAARMDDGAWLTMLCVPFAFLLHLAVVVGPMWNRRAARLARRRDWTR
jgi:hypothetical protein